MNYLSRNRFVRAQLFKPQIFLHTYLAHPLLQFPWWILYDCCLCVTHIKNVFSVAKVQLISLTSKLFPVNLMMAISLFQFLPTLSVPSVRLNHLPRILHFLPKHRTQYHLNTLDKRITPFSSHNSQRTLENPRGIPTQIYRNQGTCAIRLSSYISSQNTLSYCSNPYYALSSLFPS